MIQEEKINRFVAKKRVKDNLALLNEKNKTIKSIYEITFSRPNYTFLEVLDNAGVKEITYQEANKKIKVFGSYFKSVIKENSKYVGLLLDNKPEWIYSFYGLLMYGYIPILLSTRNDHKDNEEILKKLHASYLISDLNDDLGVNLINPLDDINNEINPNEDWANEVVFISSGTSGPNKIVAFTGEEICTQIFNGGDIFKKTPILASYYKGYLKHLVVLPFYHIFGFISVFLWFSFFNVTFVLPLNLSIERIRQACAICEPTHIFAVPLFFETMTNQINQTVKLKKLDKKFKKAINLSLTLQKIFPHLGIKLVRNVLFKKYLSDILGPSIRICITGGAQITSDTLKVINGIGYPLVNGYGSTEIGISSFANPKHIKDRITPNIGKPFSIFTYILEPSEYGQELYVKGASIFNKAFINNEWVSRDKSKPIRTYDVATLKDSKYYLKGRMDEIFIGANGENKSMSEIESSFILSHALDVVLIQNDEQKLNLLLSYSKDANEYQIAHDLSILENSKEFTINNIKNVYITNLIFPKANGIKIKREKVKELFTNNSSEFKRINLEDYRNILHNEKYDEFIVSKIIEIFKKKYPNYEINPNTDYFNDLHGNSLDYFYLVEEVEKAFNLTSNKDFSLCRTPAEFSRKIKELSTL